MRGGERSSIPSSHSMGSFTLGRKLTIRSEQKHNVLILQVVVETSDSKTYHEVSLKSLFSFYKSYCVHVIIVSNTIIMEAVIWRFYFCAAAN